MIIQDSRECGLTTNFKALLVSPYWGAFLLFLGDNFCLSPNLMIFGVGKYITGLAILLKQDKY